MAEWEHCGGFSVDTAACVEAHERDGLERLRAIDPERLVYAAPRPDRMAAQG